MVDRSRGSSERADELAAVQLREFACSRGEFVVGDHHGLAAILHGRTRDHLLHGARADGAGLPFALNGKAIGPLTDDEVDAPVARDGRHDHRQARRPCDPRDVVLELHTGHGRAEILGRTRGARADERAQQEPGCRCENGRCEGTDRQTPRQGGAEEGRRDA